MVKCLKLSDAEFHKGRPAMAPHVKDDEDLIRDNEDVNDDTREEVCESWKQGLSSYEDDEEEPAYFACVLELSSIERSTPAFMEVDADSVEQIEQFTPASMNVPNYDHEIVDQFTLVSTEIHNNYEINHEIVYQFTVLKHF